MLFPHPPRPPAPSIFPTPLSRQLPAAVPSHLEVWLEQLKRHQPIERAERLCLTVAKYNQNRLLPATRLLVLEMLRPQVFKTCQDIERRHRTTGVDTPDAILGAYRLMQLLHMHLRRGYRMLFAANVALPAESMARAIQRCMSSAKEIQVLTAFQYQRAPEGLWLKLHEHFQLAVNANLQEIGVLDHCLHTASDQTVEQAYIDNLLFALLQPQRLPHSRIRGVANSLTAISSQVDLLSAGPDTTWGLATGLDQPFRCFAHDEQGARLQLDVQSLLHAIGADGALSEIKLLRGLNLALDGQFTQHIRRAPTITPIEVVVDVPELLRHLTSCNPNTSEALQAPRFGARQHEDAWEKAGVVQFVPELLPEELKMPLEKPLGDTEQALPEPPRYNARILGQDEEGKILHWQNPDKELLKVGALIAWREAAGTPWRLECVNWALHNSKGHLILGLQQWAAMLSPCLVKPRLKSVTDMNYRPAMLLSDEKGEQSLLLPTSYMSDAPKAWLKTSEINQPILLNKCLGSSDQGNRFAFTSLAQFDPQAHPDAI